MRPNEVITTNQHGQIISSIPLKVALITEKIDEQILIDMVKIPSGEFLMGASEEEQGSDSSERPQHQVTITSFLMSQFPITHVQWEAIMGSHHSDFKGFNHPVVSVTWKDAAEFCQKISQITSKNYRLPSEAEWEYACRAGTTTPFHFGDKISTELANYRGDTRSAQNYPYHYGPDKFQMWPSQIGSFPPNAFGLYDMHGNVLEWCQDNWHENYEGAPTDGRAWINEKKSHVLRGGCWRQGPRHCRSAHRVDSFPHLNCVGFRVVCSVHSNSV